ncbi:site-specific recombinase XerD [Thaumarchaeota archaeon SCGC AB-539-E09]|nr:site-specific recombinase XerD [Thaumarchaeota archaeon SCGC AB-539-E09]
MIVTNEEKTVTGDISDVKSTLFEYAWWLKKEGYAESTIETRFKLLRILSKRGANLHDPESIKEVIAQQKWVNKRKMNAADAYSAFLRMKGMTWNPPRYRPIIKLPFIPTESELDALISGCGSVTSIFLQLLKETAMRAGEAQQVTWNDIDFERKTIRVTPEKGSNPRIFKLSTKLTSRLQTLRTKKKSKEVFGKYLRNRRRLFQKQRATLARKLENPRLKEIKFHTFRHWKATMLYHQTKDLLFVQRFLGHRSVQNTLKYIQLDEALFSDEDEQYVCKAASTVKEAMKLIEFGFQHVTDFDGVKLFKKRM